MRSMTLQFFRVVMRAGICCIIFLVLIVQGSDMIISNFFAGSSLQENMTEQRVVKLMNYVEDHKLAATDYNALQEWCDKQPLVLMEVYRDNCLLFNSYYYEDTEISDQNIEVVHYDWYSYYKVPFSDGNAELLIYSDESYVLKTLSKLIGLSLASVFFMLMVLHSIKKAIRYVYTLADEIAVLGNGDLNHPFTIRGNNELTLLANGLEDARKSLTIHRRNEEAMMKQNNEMITGLSHDLRTPLTKIALCVEIIQAEKYRDGQEINDYLLQIRQNVFQLKEISEHLLEYALTQNSFQAMQCRVSGFQEALFEHLSGMVDYLIELDFDVASWIEWYPYRIEIIDLNVRRILDNIISNIEKYADHEAPISIVSVQSDEYIGFLFTNKKKKIDRKEGFHVGLVNLHSLLAQMGGVCNISDKDEYFSIEILFRYIGKET